MKRPSPLIMALRVLLIVLVLLPAAWYLLGPPAVVKDLADPERRMHAETVLTLCGQWSKGSLLAVARDEDRDPATRAAALRFLGEAAGDWGDAAPEVAEELALLAGPESQAHAEVRLAAAEALVELADEMPPARQGLMAALHDPDGRVRMVAARYFDAPEAQALMAEEWAALLADQEPMVRLHAARALRRLGPAASPALNGLIAALDDPSPLMRTLAIQALGDMGLAEESSPELRSSALTDLLGDDQCGGAAGLALLQMGELGREALVAGLDAPDSKVRAQAALALARMDQDFLLESTMALELLARNLQDQSMDVAENSARVLMALGPKAAPQLGQVLQAMRNQAPEVRILAAQVAGAVGREGELCVPALADLLQDESQEVREAAAQALVVFGPEMQRAAPKLVQSLADDSASVRLAVATCMLNLTRLDPVHVPVLAAALEDHETQVRRAAAHGLGLMDLDLGAPQGQGAAQALRHVLEHDSDLAVIAQAALTLARLEDEAPQTVAALHAAMQNATGVELLGIAMSLGSLGRNDPALPQLLAQDAGSDDPSLRQAAAAVLYWLDGGQDRVLDLLLDLAQDQEFSIRVSAAMALGRQGRDSDAAVSLLCDLLDQDPSPHVRKAAAVALGDAGRGSVEAAQALLATLGAEDGSLRLEAAVSLRRLQPATLAAAPDAVPSLVGVLDDEEDAVRTAAALCLGALAQTGEADQALAAAAADVTLETLGKDGSIEDRVAAAAALAAMGRMDRDLALQHVEQGLELDDVYFRGSAYWALNLLGLEPEQVLEILAPGLADDSALVRASALAALEPLGQAAEPALAAALADPSPMVRSQAASSLTRIGPSLPETIAALEDRARLDMSLAVRYDARAALAAAR